MPFGIIKTRKGKASFLSEEPYESFAPSDEDEEDSALIEGSGVSSLELPDDNDSRTTDSSSINTTTYDFKGDMRILGTMEHDEELPPEPQMDAIVSKKGEQAQAHSHYEHKLAYGQGKFEDEKSLATTGSERDGECLPEFLLNAPRKLKIVIVLSTALFIGAVVLIGVGAALAMQEEVDGNGINSGSAGDFLENIHNEPFPTGFGPVAAPTPGPTAPAQPTTSSPVGDPNIFIPATPTQVPISQPSINVIPTDIVTSSPTSSTVSFFVIGGKFLEDSLEALPEQLSTLPNLDGNSVLFHLGDWNSPFNTKCDESSYEDNVALYRNSAIPVYFIPGDNEFNDCPNPKKAFQFWYEYILGFESKFWPAPTAWNVVRDEPDYPENLVYINNRLLIVCINLVGGAIHDEKEWQTRQAADLAWIDENYYKYEGQFDAMVILAHSDPDNEDNAMFFDTFYDRVGNDYSEQVIYIHRNPALIKWSLEPEYNDISNLIVVVVEGDLWPPMLVQIDTKAGVVDIDQDGWYTKYMNGELV